MLKSTRMRTRLPLTSTSVMASLFERDMLEREVGMQGKVVVNNRSRKKAAVELYKKVYHCT